MANGIRTLLLLADSFDLKSAKSRIIGRVNTFLMRAPCFDVVANHGIAAARQLVEFGAPAHKVVAWDYPSFNTPADRSAKSAPGPHPVVFYCGLVSHAKGVFDLVDAVGQIRASGRDVRLQIAGCDLHGAVASYAAAHGMAGAVDMLGLVPNDTIIDRMRTSDAVVVPSRHEYSEGLPLTIYEAYCSRTPLIASDHPMFAGAVEKGVSGLIFTGGSVDALAASITQLLDDRTLYARLSRNGEAAWQRLQIDIKWHDLIDRWLVGGRSLRDWLVDHTVSGR